ncbi:MAG: phosphate ABC transporter ATP-binding protein [Eubacteriaceae bacterium]|nr:phosphate ABC transporter ATP-binding protein [Eubacteriaceae bacterium]
MAKISIKDLKFFYGSNEVIHGISLDIAANEILALIGPANSGITTLLRSINRLYELTPGARMEGEITLDGDDINASSVSITELRRKVGMVFDIPTPLPLSIFDNVAYGPRLSGNTNKQDLMVIVEKSLRLAAVWDDVKDRLSEAASSLSGGQQQRLCIARVLALEPEVILLDRPCSGLDPISTTKLEGSLEELKKDYTIVIAPHNTQQAVRVSDSVAFLLMGDLIEAGPTSEVFVTPKDTRTSDYITGRFG